MSLKVAVNAFKWGIDHTFMLTQLTATPIFQRLAYGEFYCKGLYMYTHNHIVDLCVHNDYQIFENDNHHKWQHIHTTEIIS